jgi:hypothetical protein
VRLQFAQYFIAVYGASAPGVATHFTLRARYSDDAAAAPPVAGGGGALEPHVVTSDEVRLPGDRMAMTVGLNTSSDAAAAAYQYRLY